MMAYQNDFVVSIINNGKPVREFSENGTRTAAVPFGSEYKIRLKNKKRVRAKVKVYVDGMDTLSNGGYFILSPYQTLDLERFVDDLDSGRKFKFISIEEGIRTGEIQDPTSFENGRIKVEFYPEVEYQFNQGDWWNKKSLIKNGSQNTLRGQSLSSTLNNSTTSFNDQVTFTNSLGSLNDMVKCCDAPVDCAIPSSAGATVEGSQSSQGFSLTTEDFMTVGCTVVDLKLRGPKAQQPEVFHQTWIVVMKKGKPYAVELNGSKFTSTSDGAKISITNEGLHIQGTGLDIKTANFTVRSE